MINPCTYGISGLLSTMKGENSVRLRILVVLIILGSMLLVVRPTQAATTDFEAFANGTTAAALTVAGVTFSGTGWQIYEGYSGPPNVMGKVLGTFSGDLTMTFDVSQSSITFGYGTFSDFRVEGYLGGALIKTQTFRATGAGSYSSLSFSSDQGFDTIRLVFLSSDDAVIDNLVTTPFTASASGPGCDLLMPPVPANAAVGKFIDYAPTYWSPGQLTSPLVTLGAGKSALVLGTDESGAYYKIYWGCSILWVPVDSMGPNYDAVWQGWPLPTDVVPETLAN